MNLPSENTRSGSLSMTDLVQRNAQALEIIDLIPYQPTVYAIPEQWLEKEMQLLADAAQFQPTLYRLISNLATREEISQMQTDQKAQIYRTLDRYTKDVMYQLQQDGKAREKFFSKLSAEVTAEVRKLQDEYDKQQKKNLQYMGITVGASAVLSALVSGLLLLLGG